MVYNFPSFIKDRFYNNLFYKLKVIYRLKGS